MIRKRMGRCSLIVLLAVAVTGFALAQKPTVKREAKPREHLYLDPIDVTPALISTSIDRAAARQ